MEPFYSSDDEIAWGPVSRYERKRELLRSGRKLPSRRYSSIVQYKSSPSSIPTDTSGLIPELIQESIEKLSMSTDNNEDCAQNDTQDKKDITDVDLLNELPKCHAESTPSKVETVNENEVLNDSDRTYINFMKKNIQRSTIFDVANIRHSLVENTIILSSDEENLNETYEKKVTERSIIVKSEAKDNYTIILSDDSSVDYDASVAENKYEIESSNLEKLQPNDFIHNRQYSSTKSVCHETKEDLQSQHTSFSNEESNHFNESVLVAENKLYEIKPSNLEKLQPNNFIHSRLDSSDKNVSVCLETKEDLQSGHASFSNKEGNHFDKSVLVAENKKFETHPSNLEKLEPNDFIHNRLDTPDKNVCLETKEDFQSPHASFSNEESDHSGESVLVAENKKYEMNPSNFEKLKPNFIPNKLDSPDNNLSVCFETKEDLQSPHTSFSNKERNHFDESGETVENGDHGDFKCNPESANLDSQSNACGYSFNDTMEEMELALQEGLDYVMPSEKRNDETQKFEAYSVHRELGSEAKVDTPTHFKNVAVVTPNVINKTGQNKEKDVFKVPTKISNNKFKDIISPVRIYIQNSSSPWLKKNVPVKSSPKLAILSPTVKQSVSDTDFPKIIYKPSKSKIVSRENEIGNLPLNIQRLIKETELTRHEQKLTNMQETIIKQNLFDSNLTVNSSLLEKTQDLSIVTNKQIYKK